MLIKRFPQNIAGRDFVCGDIHGSFDLLLTALRKIDFDPARDRLFSVGDTVDRGPHSHRALGFLRTPWVHAVRGNHEDMFLELYQNGEPSDDVLAFATRANGMSWWRAIAPDQRLALIAEFQKLPIAIEIETKRGTVGLLHAEVPPSMDWQTFLARLEASDAAVINHALWSRGRVTHRDATGVSGVGRIFCGHTPLEGPQRLGNVFYIDSGAVFGVLKADAAGGRLVLADIAASTACFSSPAPDLHFDLRTEPSTTPFSAYA